MVPNFNKNNEQSLLAVGLTAEKRTVQGCERNDGLRARARQVRLIIMIVRPPIRPADLECVGNSKTSYIQAQLTVTINLGWQPMTDSSKQNWMQMLQRQEANT
ncbi:hypothetical protein Csa_010890 [Cucumis sativus]|nr:hypothetical protein Csa_010890 [Cucumis sativus]